MALLPKIAAAIVEKGVDGDALAKAIAERPEQFGALRGRAGLLGENKERKTARQFARALGNHVGAAAETWTRRLQAERDSETWQREKRDVVEVPGLTPRSERILKQLDDLPQAQKAQFVKNSRAILRDERRSMRPKRSRIVSNSALAAQTRVRSRRSWSGSGWLTPRRSSVSLTSPGLSIGLIGRN